MAKKRYEDVREKIFGERGWIDNVRSKVKGILPNQIKYFTETFVNLRRFFKGVVSVENLSFLVQRRLEELRNSRIRIEVLEREDFLSKKFCQEFLAGVDKKRVETNKATVSRLLDNEVFGEIGCLHCLRIDGVSLKLFHHLVGWMGGRSNVLLAGDKQANGGCATFESSGSNPFKPFLGSFADDEERLYWQGEDSDFVEEGGELKEKRGRRFSSFVRAIKGGKIGSRLHARIFCIKDRDGKDVIILPVHVDMFDVMAVVEEKMDVWRKRKKEKRKHNVLDFHRLAFEGKEHIGTGLYELGCV